MMIKQFFVNCLNTMKRELGFIGRDPIYLFSLLVLPLVSILFFVSFLSIGVPRQIPIAIVDEDQSVISRKLVSMLEACPSLNVTCSPVDMLESENLIYEGKVYAVVQIVKGLEKNVLGGAQGRVILHNSGANLTTNGLISKDVQTAVISMGVGIQLNVLQAKGLTARQAMAQAMPVRMVRHVLGNPYINYGYFLAPCFLAMMLMIFTILLSVYAIGSELKNATCIDWIHTAGDSITAALAGKLAMINLFMTLYAVLCFMLMTLYMGVPMNGSVVMIFVGMIILLSAYQGIGVFLISLTCNLRLSLSLCGGYSVLAFTFSGLTFPAMAMSEPIQWFTHIFPFTYYMELFIDQSMRGAPWFYSLPLMGYMMLFWIAPVVCVPKLLKTCKNKKYWGRV